MSTTIADFVCVADRIRELGCVAPAGIAVLPNNIAVATTREELRFGSEAATIRKLFRNHNFRLDELLPTGERVPSIHNKHFEWAPLLFISAGFLSQDPNAIAVVLGIISNYATDFFKGMPGRELRLELIVEKTKDRTCKKLTYQGDSAGIESLSDTIRKLADD